MRRRRLLAALAGTGAGLAGCLGLRDTAARSGEPPTPRSTPDGTAGSTGTPPTPPESQFPRRVTVATVADGPTREALDVAAEVSAVDDTVTAEETATVTLGLRTTVDAPRTVTYEQQHCSRNEFRARSGEDGLFLFPAGGGWTARDAACPVVGRPNLDCGIPVTDESVTVPASGTLTWRYSVVVPPRNAEHGRCVAPGEYRFTRLFRREGTTASLAFSLQVTAP